MEIISAGSDALLKLTAEIAEEIWRQHFAGIIAAGQIEYMLEKFQSYEAMKKQVSDEKYRYYLIKDENNSYQGYFAIAPMKDYMFLSKIYIRQASRGKGYAGKALEFIKDSARKENLINIVLTVNRNNTETVNIYKKMNFEITGEADKDIGGGFFMNDYIMSLGV